GGRGHRTDLQVTRNAMRITVNSMAFRGAAQTGADVGARQESEEGEKGREAQGLRRPCLSAMIADRQGGAMSKPEEVPASVRILAAQLAHRRPLRRGSLGERYLKWGKPNCACATHEEARHGPYFSLTRVVDGHTRSRRLSARQAERVREQLAAGQEFRRQV